MWDDQVEALRDGYRVIRHDTRGFGETETEAVSFSNRADIGAMLDHLGEPSAHLVGLSRGGQIALDFALEFPERVRSLTVAAGGVGGYDSPDELPAETWEAVEAMEEARDWEALSDWETAFWADGPGQSPDRVPEVRRRVHEWVLTNYRAEKGEGEPQPLDPPAETRLVQLDVPLLVMLGTLDDPGTVDSMRHLAASVPGARLEEFESAHMVNLEHPARFNRVLRTFLDGILRE
jgi:pimeloyl-ACP methyl ester carboxylesterase